MPLVPESQVNGSGTSPNETPFNRWVQQKTKKHEAKTDRFFFKLDFYGVFGPAASVGHT